MKAKSREVKKKKKRGEKRKTRGRLREFKEEEVAWAPAGEGGEEPRRRAARLRSFRAGDTREGPPGASQKVTGRFGAAPLENASPPLAESRSRGKRDFNGRTPPPALAACAEDEEGRAEGTGGHSRSSPRALLGQEEALHPPVARPGDAQTFVTLTHGRRSCERGPEQLLCLGLSNPTAATDALCPNEER